MVESGHPWSSACDLLFSGRKRKEKSEERRGDGGKQVVRKIIGKRKHSRLGGSNVNGVLVDGRAVIVGDD